MREDQVRRYARHVLLPDVGGVGQRRLLASTVSVGDAGAAGAAAIAYLAAAGVGTIVIADGGRVQKEDVGALYEAADVGRARSAAAKDRVAALNGDVVIGTDTAGAGLWVRAIGGDALAIGAALAEEAIRVLVARAEEVTVADGARA